MEIPGVNVEYGIIDWDDAIYSVRVVYIRFPEGCEGGRFTLSMDTYEYDDWDDILVTNAASLDLFVIPPGSALTAVTIGSGKETIEQTADTVKRYSLQAEPEDARLNKVNVAVTQEGQRSVDAYIDPANGYELVVTIKPIKDGAETLAVITLTEGSNEVGKVTIQPTAPAVKGADLKVEYDEKNSTDVALRLKVTTPKNLVRPELGSLWYKVEATPKAGTKPSGVSEGKQTFYLKQEYDSSGELAASQILDIKVNGNGVGWEYDVNVTLVQLIEDFDPEWEDDAAFVEKTAYSSKTQEISAKTKNPSYATKITLKKKTTTVYTGQRDVEIAAVSFDKDATFISIDSTDIKDLKYDGYEDEIPVSFYAKNGSIYMSVDKNLDTEDGYWDSNVLGKHTIKVTAKAADDMHTVSATIVVDVVQGIHELSLDAATDQLYKATNKAASLKTTLTYNDGLKQYAPKAKKVQYKLVTKDTKTGKYKPYENSAVTVNTKGVVSVNKSYTVDESNNTFCVQVIADDFAGNSATVAYTDPVTITSETKKLAAVYIAHEKWEKNEDGERKLFYEVIAESDQTKTSGELDGMRVIATYGGMEKKNVYSADEIAHAYAADYLTYKSSNKALTIDKYGYITVNKANVKNITITVSTNDGDSTNNAKLTKLAIDYAKPELGLRIERQSVWDGTYEENFNRIGNTDYEYETQSISYNTTSDSVLRFTVLQKDGEKEYNPICECANYKIAVSGAKVLKKETSAYGQVVTTVIPNKKDVVVTLTDSGNQKSAVRYTITNTAFSSPTLKASNVKTSDKLIANTNQYQQIRYTVTGLSNDLLDLCKADKLYVMIKTDASDRNNTKKKAAYASLESAGSVIGCMPVELCDIKDKNGNVTGQGGEFCIDFWNAVPVGSYKLQLTFGENSIDDETYNEVVPKTKAMAITLKATATKKGSYKPISTIKMSVKDMASVQLAGTGKNFINERYFNLRNANLNGKSNGFTDYFEADYDEENIIGLHLKSSYEIKRIIAREANGGSSPSQAQIEAVTNEQLNERLAWITGSSSDAKAVRIGFISYEVFNLDGSLLKRDTVKITVNFTNSTSDMAKVKTVSAYAVSSPKIMKGVKIATVNITAAKKPAEIAFAYAESEDGGFSTDPYADGSAITLTTESILTEKAYPVTLYIVPWDSYYAEEIGELAYAWKYAQENAQPDKDAKKESFVTAIKDKGIKLTPKVTVVKKSTTKKIAITKQNLTQQFRRNSENGLRGYDGIGGNYWIDVPYTTNVGVYIAEASSDTNGIEFDPNYDRGDGDYLSIIVNKKALENGVLKGKAGTKIKVKTTLKFGTEHKNDENGYASDDDIKTETFTFTLTLPTLPEIGNYQDAVKNVQDNWKTIQDAVKLKFWNEMNTDIYEDWDGNYHVDSYFESYNEDTDEAEYLWNDLFGTLNEAIWNVYDNITEYAPEDSGTTVVMKQYRSDDSEGFNEWLEFSNSDFTAPTSKESGKFIVRAELWDSSYVQSKTSISFTLTIDPTKEKAVDVEDAIEDFIREVNDKNIYNLRSNDVYYDEIARAARDYVKMNGYSTLRLDIWDPEWDEDGEYRVEGFGWVSETKQDATEGENGYIIGRIHVWGTRYGGSELVIPFTFIIPKLNPEVGELKGKLDSIIHVNIEDLEKIDGIDKMEYDDERNVFTVKIKDGTKKVKVSYEAWKREHLADCKTKLVNEITDTFGDEWEDVNEISVMAKVTVPNSMINKTREQKVTVKKNAGESIAAFVDRMQEELDKKYEAALDKYSEDADKLIFEHLIGATGNIKVTVVYTEQSGKASAEQGYFLTIK